jgi:hypothetical protein
MASARDVASVITIVIITVVMSPNRCASDGLRLD